MATRIAYTFRSNDYETITSLVRDEAWPDTFEGWSEKHRQNVREMESLGGVVEQVVIDPHQYSLYCLRSGMDYNVHTLGAFAVVVAREKRERGA